MATVNPSNLPAPIRDSFVMKLLSVPTPTLIHNAASEYYIHPRNGGTNARFRRYNALETAMVPLGNTGVTPPAQELSAVDIDAKISFYGSWLKINEQVVLQNQDPVLNEAAKRLGVSMRQTEDELTRNMLASTAAFINCVNGTNGDNPTNITRDDVNEIVRTLVGSDAKTLTEGIEGENRFGTAPVRDAFFAMAHSDLISNLDGVAGFLHKTAYPAPMRGLPSEWGSVGNLRFLVSSVGSVDTAKSHLGADVYNIFCVGQEAYGCVKQDGYTASFIYRDPMYDGPLAQNSTVGFKMAQVPRILNDLWVLNLRTTLA